MNISTLGSNSIINEYNSVNVKDTVKPFRFLTKCRRLMRNLKRS